MHFELYQILVDDVGMPKEAAARFIRALEREMDKRVDFGVNAVRGDIANLAAMLVGVKSELVGTTMATNAAMAGLAVGMKAELAAMREVMTAELAQTRTDLRADNRIVSDRVSDLRWLFGAVAAAVGLAASLALHFVR
jgi:ATP phosphoribosyltransferase regulatory subunit HisZ